MTLQNKIQLSQEMLNKMASKDIITNLMVLFDHLPFADALKQTEMLSKALNRRKLNDRQATVDAVQNYLQENPEFKAVQKELEEFIYYPSLHAQKVLEQKILEKSKKDFRTINELFTPINIYTPSLVGDLSDKASVFCELKKSLMFTNTLAPLIVSNETPQKKQDAILERTEGNKPGSNQQSKWLEQFKENHAKIAKFKKIVRENKQTLARCRNDNLAKTAIKAIATILPSLAYALGAEKIGNALLSQLWKPKSQVLVDKCSDILSRHSSPNI
ncbi:MAG: hypothetical protein HKM04_01595 [Legionellales bacterium]|nr:hypothetical protein [Legionellales bacterium]